MAERGSWLETYAFICLYARLVIHGDQVQNTKGSWRDHDGGHVEDEKRSMMDHADYNYQTTISF